MIYFNALIVMHKKMLHQNQLFQKAQTQYTHENIIKKVKTLTKGVGLHTRQLWNIHVRLKNQMDYITFLFP